MEGCEETNGWLGIIQYGGIMMEGCEETNGWLGVIQYGGRVDGGV